MEPSAESFRPAVDRQDNLPNGRRGNSLLKLGASIERNCDRATAVLLYLMVIFSPWAFGTTEPWSIWTMTISGYVLGLLLTIKCVSRRLTGFQPARWGENQPLGALHCCGRELRWTWILERSLAVTTGLILVYCFIGALNARATYDSVGRSFDYHESYLHWLPHSYDSGRSWGAFWNYLGLACTFWAVRDWLMTPSPGEIAELSKRESGSGARRGLLPARLRRLLWVLSINAGLLGMEGTFQRLSGSGKLLWLVEPRVNPGGETQFGPYAYRANAAQLLNLIWPVGLGLWWSLQQAAMSTYRRVSGVNGWRHLLLPFLIVIGACPIIATTRGGAMIAAGNIAVGTLLLLTQRRAPWLWRIGTIVFCCLILWLAVDVGWKQLSPRLDTTTDSLRLREESYDIGRKMAADYPVFGTGPKTFSRLFQIYRLSPDVFWLAQMHNDWLETRITFGWVGMSLILLALLLVILRWFAPGGLPTPRRFVILAWLALGGCLVHARYDFPLQIHSILFLFLIICAVLSCLSRRT